MINIISKNKMFLIAVLYLIFFTNFTIFGAAVGVVNQGAPSQGLEPISLAIVYHQQSYYEMERDGRKIPDPINIDNGAVADGLERYIDWKASAILVNGVVAYPLILAALTHAPSIKIPAELQRDVKKLEADEKWRNIKSTFLTEWTPYLVKNPEKHFNDPSRAELTNERFILFIRKGAGLKVDQAFDMTHLELQSFDLVNNAKNVFDLLAVINQHTLNINALAKSIQTIFNPTQKIYSWNIVIKGHGSSISRIDDMPLFARQTTQHEVLANIPPRQATMLLNFFTSMPTINIVYFITCYGGGYNANLLEQQLDILENLHATLRGKMSFLTEENRELFKEFSNIKDRLESNPGAVKSQDSARFIEIIKQIKRKPEQQRKFILVSQAAFDKTTHIPRANFILAFKQFFKITPRPDDEALKRNIKNTLSSNCEESPIILMPTSKEFELLANDNCLDEFIEWALSKKEEYEPPVSPRSFDFMLKIAEKLGPQHIRMVIYAALEASKKNLRLLDASKNFESFHRSHKNQKDYEYYENRKKNCENIDKIYQNYINKLTSRYPEQFRSAQNPKVFDNFRLFRDIKKEDLEQVKKLLDQNLADIEARDDNDNTPLILAAQGNNFTLIEFLLKHGANVNAKNRDGITPLMFTIKRYQEASNQPIVWLLLSKGADITIQNNNKKTALDIARQINDVASAAILQKCAENPQERLKIKLIYAAQNGDIKTTQSLLNGGVDIEAKNFDGSTPLMLALREGKTDVVQLLLNRNADVNAVDAQGATPLTYALSNQSIDKKIIELLIEKGANVNAKNTDGNTPLMDAIQNKSIDQTIIELMISKNADVNAQTPDGTTALMLAAKSGTPWKVELLLKHGAHVNDTSTDGTALIMATTAKPLNAEIIQALVGYGADVTVSLRGGTALQRATKNGASSEIQALLKPTENPKALLNNQLFYAVKKGQPDRIQKLIDAGAEVNAKNHNGDTPLILAVKGYAPKKDGSISINLEIALLLLGQDADTTIKNNAEKSALDIARTIAHQAPSEEINVVVDTLEKCAQDPQEQRKIKLIYAAKRGFKDTVKSLINAGVDLEARDLGDNTPLILAAQEGKDDVIALLLDRKALANAHNSEGVTPLIAAVQNESIDEKTIESLIAKGADVNAKTDTGMTPLLFAALNNSAWKVELLLDHGADINAKNSSGKTALHLTAANNKLPIIALLLDKGVDAAIKDNRGKTAADYALKEHFDDIYTLLQKPQSKR